MNKFLPDLVGTAGGCLLTAGIYCQFGQGIALIVGGTMLMAGAFLWGRV